MIWLCWIIFYTRNYCLPEFPHLFTSKWVWDCTFSYFECPSCHVMFDAIFEDTANCRIGGQWALWLICWKISHQTSQICHEMIQLLSLLPPWILWFSIAGRCWLLESFHKLHSCLEGNSGDYKAKTTYSKKVFLFLKSTFVSPKLAQTQVKIILNLNSKGILKKKLQENCLSLWLSLPSFHKNQEF